LHVSVVTKRFRSGNGPMDDLNAALDYFVSQRLAGGVRLTTQRLAVLKALAQNVTYDTAEGYGAHVRFNGLPHSGIARK